LLLFSNTIFKTLAMIAESCKKFRYSYIIANTVKDTKKTSKADSNSSDIFVSCSLAFAIIRWFECENSWEHRLKTTTNAMH